jgi:hypothetical protein
MCGYEPTHEAAGDGDRPALPLTWPLVRAGSNMSPVISTIVMLRLFARRQRASTSAYFTNSLTPLSRLDLLASFRGGALSRSASAWLGRSQKDGLPSRSGSAWLGRSQKDGLPSCRGETCFIDGSRPSTRAKGRGSPVAAPF